ncbi:MAG TPA: hypothetical protein ENK67_06500 [Flavobacteriia bacterium]|nr:hypothetical protein [Flavobacteriia bacterium]
MSELEKSIEQLIAQKEALQQQSKDLLAAEPALKVVSDMDMVENAKQIKSDLISKLRMAKTSHMKWISDVQILIRLGDVEQANAKVPVNYTSCDFGRWYYSDGQMLSEYSEYTDIEEIHQLVHDTYLQIYSLYKKPIEGGFFNSAKKQLAEREEKALKLDIILKRYSKLLFELLVTLENKIKSLSDQEILNLI